MDNSFEELENELGRLRPRPTSPALLDRLERELGPAMPTPSVRPHATATNLRSWKWAGWSLAGAAAAALLIVMRFSREPVISTPAAAAAQVVAAAPTAVPVNRYEPVKATSVLYDLKEDGLATLPDQTEGRQVRYRYVDTYTWRNPATKASLRWSVPRDEVRVVRASLN
jgi:hypothetical protein